MARTATIDDSAAMVVTGPVPGRLILGRVHGRLVWRRKDPATTDRGSRLETDVPTARGAVMSSARRNRANCRW
jgi:hypothetical protein